MKKNVINNMVDKVNRASLLLIFFIYQFFASAPLAYAATTPSLGEAESFSILSNTYTNTVGGTTLTGDLGYTTGPATAPTVNGTTYSPPSTKYSTAGTDQGSALSALNAQLPCDFTFAPGAIDLATDVTNPNGVGNFVPGIYCIDGAATIGGGGTITLTGSGTYIFRMTGALTTSANSIVTLAGGASACDVFWTPGAATTLGADSTFVGTNIDDSGITIGSNVTWEGRALAFGGTVSTDTDTITTPTCTTDSDSSTSTSSTDSTSSQSSSSNASAPNIFCPPIVSTAVTPIIIESRRVDADSIFISWGPYSGTDQFNVRYGLTNGNWLYNTDVTGFSTTINDLPANQPIWIQIAPRNSCAVGTYSEPRFVGGPTLPNTGFDPSSATNTWSSPSIHGFFSELLKL